MLKQPSNDLIVLVADKNMEYTVRGLLSRPERLGIRSLNGELRILVHPQRDPGCLLTGHDLLKLYTDQFAHGLIMFDREGCGQDKRLSHIHLEQRVEKNLARSNWTDKAATIVFDPELEIWIWSDSPHVETILGWGGRQPSLREWLRNKNYIKPDEIKPKRPKEAAEEVLRIVRKPRSSAIYRELAEKVSFERCTDKSFLKFKTTLQKWFPPESK